jgi:hypothetical protein
LYGNHYLIAHRTAQQHEAKPLYVLVVMQYKLRQVTVNFLMVNNGTYLMKKSYARESDEKALKAVCQSECSCVMTGG